MKLVLIILGLIALAGLGVAGGYYYASMNQPELPPEVVVPAPVPPPEMTVCTMDAMICPDGSAVGRSGPNCEFDPCPESSEPGTASGMMLDDSMPAELDTTVGAEPGV